MKAYILGENKTFPLLITQLEKMMDIYANKHQYSLNYPNILKKSDLLLKTSFTDVIILLDLNILGKKITLEDGEIVFDERIIENYKNCLWVGLYKNDKLDTLIDKYNLNFIDLSLTMPYYLTSKIALSEIILEKILNSSHKLAHQNKVLIANYSDYNKIIADLLSANKNIVIVSDKMLHILIEAKNDGFGIILKEELTKQPIKFDYVICDDIYYLNLIKFHDNQKVFFIDYKESNNNIDNVQIIKPFTLISEKYDKIIAESIATSIKKEVKEYFRGE